MSNEESKPPAAPIPSAPPFDNNPVNANPFTAPIPSTDDNKNDNNVIPQPPDPFNKKKKQSDDNRSTIYLERNYDGKAKQGSNTIDLKIVELDVNTASLKQLCVLNVVSSITLNNLYKNILHHMNNSGDSIKLEMAYHWMESNRMEVFCQFDSIMDVVRHNEIHGMIPITNGDIIYICTVPQRLIPFLNHNKDFIRLKYNTDIDIVMNMNNPPNSHTIQYDGTIEFNLNQKVGEVREILMDKLNAKEIILRKGYRSDELKDDNMTLKQCAVYQTGHVFVERGAPNKNKNEYIFAIFVQNEFVQRKVLPGFIRQHIDKELDKNYAINVTIPESVINVIFFYYYINTGDQPLIFIGDIYLNKKDKLDVVKKKIYDKYKAYVPLPKVMRLREFSKGTLTHLYLDEYSLGKNVKKYNPLKDYKAICCQRILSTNDDQRENILTSEHVLLNICRWYPSQLSFGPMLEMSFKKNIVKTTKFYEELAFITTISKDNLRIKYMRLKWTALYEGIAECVPDRYWQGFHARFNSWYPIEHGFVVLYKDKREELKKFEWDDIATKQEQEHLKEGGYHWN